MITPIVKEDKVVFGPCRLSYTHLFHKYVSENTPAELAKYQTAILIPKSEKETIKAIQKAIDFAKKRGVVKEWGGKEPKKLYIPLHDGDEKDDDVYTGHYYLNAKCGTKPGVIDRNKQIIEDEEEVYSGMWAIVSISFYPYGKSGNNGIACGLNNVMKYKDDDRLGGRISAEADFDDVDFDDDDDDDDL